MNETSGCCGRLGGRPKGRVDTDRQSPLQISQGEGSLVGRGQMRRSNSVIQA